MVVDTSALLAYFDQTDAMHEAVVAVIDVPDLCVVSPYVLAELDYFMASRFGRASEIAAMRELVEGDWELAEVTPEDLTNALNLLTRYGEPIGLADASSLVLAQRYRQTEIATLDRRHFSYLHLPGKPPLTIVP